MTGNAVNRKIRRLYLLIAVIATACVVPTAFAQSPSLNSAEAVAQSIRQYRERNEARIVADFAELLSLPNVADNLDDMQKNAEHIVGLLEARGFDTRILSAGGAPYVYAELSVPQAAETILIYAHFDGQPVQEENWASPPFSPTLRDGPLQAGGQIIDLAGVDGEFDPEWRLYARSTGDDKLPVIAFVHVLDAMKAAGIPPSVNIKLLLDGEEEQGSPTVVPVLEQNRELLDADMLLFCDGPMHPSRRAQLVFGVRGDMHVDITTYGPSRPLHSGHYGNWAPNPIMQLSYLLTSMRDPSGRILIDGYYDSVAPLTEQERAAIAAMPAVEPMLQDELSINTPEGEGRRLQELIMLPALNVRGIVAGGVGDKGRNVVLSSATTSLDLRLVPNQRPAEGRNLVEAHLVKQGFHVVHDDPPPDVLRAHAGVAKVDWSEDAYPALRTSLDDPMSQRLIALLRQMHPDLIVTPTSGGSLPLYAFESVLQTPIISLPVANHDNNQHAENENIRLQNLWDAMEVYGVVLAKFGDQ